MNRTEQSINESLNKIKYLMSYDSQMTHIENKEILKEQEDEIEFSDMDNPECPNSIPYDELVKKMRKVAHVVRRMNTAFVRMVGSAKRVKLIYQTIKSFQGKNTYAEDFNECTPAIQAAISYFNGYFNDWFSKGETFEEELNQLINRKYYRDDPVVQKYLQETVKLLKEQPKQEVDPEENPSYNSDDTTISKVSPASTSGYKFVKGTSDDPYKYGTLGSGIAQVQQNLGVVQDGKWGPKTNAKMKELAPDYINGYTNDNLLKVIQTIRTTKNPAPQKLSTNISPSVAEKTPMKLAPMAQQIQPTNQELKKLVRLKK